MPGAKLTPSVDNSKPSGAVTRTSPSKPAAPTVKLCVSEGVLNRVEKTGSRAATIDPLTKSVGVTAPFNLTKRSRVLPLDTLRSPGLGPLGAVLARRTRTVVATTALLVLRGNSKLRPKLVVPARAIS